MLPVELQMTSFNPLDLLISPAYAQAAGQGAQGGGFTSFSLLMPIALIAVMYFLMIRPQMKRAKEHRAMLRSEEHTSELQSLMRISYAVFCLKIKKTKTLNQH